MSERAKLLHDSPWRGVLLLTGGAGFLSEMLSVAGASRTVLEAKVPYAAASLAELLGGQPEQACSGPTARAMAMAALQRALQLAQRAGLSNAEPTAAPRTNRNAAPALSADRLFGFAVTASMATDRSKRGPCRAHVAVQTLAQTSHAPLSLSGDRPAQEAALAEHCWRTLLQALELQMPEQHPAPPTVESRGGEAGKPGDGAVGGLPDQPQAGLPAGETGEIEQVLAPEPWCSLIGGASRAILINQEGATPISQPDNTVIAEALSANHDDRLQSPTPGEAAAALDAPSDQNSKLLFPGAFNPLHEGHRRMMAIAEAKTGLAGAFELSVRNIDKPLLDYIEIQRRLAQFEHPLWLTSLPTFLEKANRFPGAIFIVGIDTLVRIANPRYYGGDAELNRALTELADRKARFLVFGRTLNGIFQGLAQVELPAALRQMCVAVSEAEFRADISSTVLRRQQG